MFAKTKAVVQQLGWTCIAFWAMVACLLYVVGVGAGLIVYWGFIEKSPLEVYSAVLNSPLQVKKGEQIEIVYLAEKDRQLAISCDVTSIIHFHDSQDHFFYKEQSSNFNRGDVNRVVRQVLIPESIATGPVQIWEVITYKCNPIKIHVIQTPKVVVEVIN